VVSILHFNTVIGAFGEVRMCVHRESGAQRAVKVLKKSNMDEDEKKMLFNEINILRNVVSTLTRPFRPPHILFLISQHLINDYPISGSSKYCEDV
jgi:serine/threonine protein kinase